MRLIDTHAHLNDERYEEDLTEVLERAAAAGLSDIILATADEQGSREAMKMANRKTSDNLALWCTVGIHPHDAKDYTEETDQLLRAWITNRKENRIVAIGEIGLDYFYDYSHRDVQQYVFRKQLDIAYELDIPFVIHERDATADFLLVLSEYAKKNRLRSVPGTCHCFSGSPETAAILLNYGFYLGFDGPLTFKNSRKAPEVVLMTPLDRLLAETDSPYLTPVPYRGRRNEPAYVSYVVEKMAEIKELSTEQMADIVSENACLLFGIPSREKTLL